MTDQMQLEGTSAPPLANGEVVFEEPWQSRVFGMARTLCEQGLFEWDEFRERLITEIRRSNPEADYRYFDHFLDALTHLLAAKELCGEQELAQLERQFAARPHGHDH